MPEFNFYKEVSKSYTETAEIILEKLQEHKFGIVSQIDLQNKFQEKLGIEFKRYTILGLCDPESAYKIVSHNEKFGLFLPCNMIVFEVEGGTAVAVVKPSYVIAQQNDATLDSIAVDVERKLKLLFDSIE